jgi:capsular exopolysaccharide synthesis family protein
LLRHDESAIIVDYRTELPSGSPDKQNWTGEPGRKPLSLSELAQLAWRRRALIIAIVALCLAAAAATVFTIAPRYTATTDILIDTKKEQVTSFEQVLSDVAPDKETILSEMEVLRSRGLAEKVVSDFQLVNDPEFNAELRPANPLAAARAWLAEALATIVPADLLVIGGPVAAADVETRVQAATLDAFLEAYEVAQKGQSRAISVSFTSASPEKAARLANALADSYLLSQLDAKFEATQRANRWLANKLQDMRQVVADSEAAVEAYRSRAGLLKSKDGTLISQQVADLNAQLMIARAESAATDARLQQVRRLVNSVDGPEVAADVLGSPIILELLRQETEVKRSVALLSEQLGDRHPRMISARNELANVESKIRVEVNKIVQKLANEAAIAQAREDSLQANLLALEADLSRANAAEVQLRALEREAGANKSMLETFLARYGEVSAQSDLSAQQTNARILSRASVPDRPSHPKRLMIMAITLVLSLGLALLLAVALESLEHGFRSSEDVEEELGVRVLGLVPVATGAAGKATPAHKHILDNPSSVFAESIRSLYTSIMISGSRQAPRSVLLTSAQPEEGKSTIAVCLARMCALSGKSTLIVDADLRKPSVHRLMGLPQAPGLVEIYHGEARLDDVLRTDEASGAMVLTAGNLLVDPLKVLSAPSVRSLLGGLPQRFDLVLIDTPPLMAVADARVLAPDMDASVFVVRWLGTSREVVRFSLKQLVDTGARLSGVVLSRVDARKHAKYGFGDSAYYYDGVKRYYTT